MRQSCLVATAILVVFIISVGANLVHVNAGQPHPLQTGGGTGGCGGEGSVSVQEWCPGTEHKRWKRGLVCRNGVQVKETQDCSGCADPERPDDIYDEGTEIVNEDCPTSPGTGYLYKTTVCEKGKWVKHEIPCVYCSPEGGSEITNYCDDGSPSLIKHCRNGVPVYEEKTCPSVSEMREKLPKKCAENTYQCIETCHASLFEGGCRTLMQCINGKWQETRDREGGTGHKECCFIATATYGSELSPEVQFLRWFRDEYVMSTHSGRAFMIMFNSFYYSFSPQVASVVASNTVVKEFMQILLRPLLTILELTYHASLRVYQVDAEAGVLLSGLIASSLLGLFYLWPIPALLAWRSRTFRRALASSRMMHVRLLLLCCLIGFVIFATLIRSSELAPVATFATSVFLMILGALLPSRLLFKAPDEED